MQSAARQLTEEEGSDQHRKGDEIRSQTGEDAEGDDGGHGQMNSQEPLARKPAYPSPPAAEWDVQEKDNCCHSPEFHRIDVSGGFPGSPRHLVAAAYGWDSLNKPLPR